MTDEPTMQRIAQARAEAERERLIPDATGRTAEHHCPPLAPMSVHARNQQRALKALLEQRACALNAVNARVTIGPTYQQRGPAPLYRNLGAGLMIVASCLGWVLALGALWWVSVGFRWFP